MGQRQAEQQTYSVIIIFSDLKEKLTGTEKESKLNKCPMGTGNRITAWIWKWQLCSISIYAIMETQDSHQKKAAVLKTRPQQPKKNQPSKQTILKLTETRHATPRKLHFPQQSATLQKENKQYRGFQKVKILVRKQHLAA